MPVAFHMFIILWWLVCQAGNSEAIFNQWVCKPFFFIRQAGQPSMDVHPSGVLLFEWCEIWVLVGATLFLWVLLSCRERKRGEIKRLITHLVNYFSAHGSTWRNFEPIIFHSHKRCHILRVAEYSSYIFLLLCFFLSFSETVHCLCI